MGARVRCAWLTSCTICASMVSLPTRSARMTRAPVPFTVAPITRAPLPFSTGMDSPVIMDSSTALAPSSTTPSTGIFSPGTHAEPVSRFHLIERDVALGSVCGDQSRHLRTQIEQRADCARGLAARAQFQNLTEKNERDDGSRGFEINVRAIAHASERRGKYSAGTTSRPRYRHRPRPCPSRSA